MIGRRRVRVIEVIAIVFIIAAIASVAYQQAIRIQIAELNSPNGFHAFYYDQEVWQQTRWLGVEVKKLPFDLFVYQDILSELKPDVVIDSGTLYGGSAYFFATIMDLLNHGKVITIDINEYPQRPRPRHPRITYLIGSSTSDAIVNEVKRLIPSGASVMVSLDSDHSRDHVLNELRRYHSIVTPGQYLVVEDTNVNGHPVLPNHGPGPMEAVDTFLKENGDFEVDRSREKYLLTFNPRGYLRKKT